MNPDNSKHELVQKAYARVAIEQSSCCQPSQRSCCCSPSDYVVPEHPVPEAELGLSCGNPLAFGHINPGDTVLDLGSGAGKDVFLAAQKVGPAGKAIGVDMTVEMLALARKNALKFKASTDLDNVEFLEGKIENLPVKGNTVDVIISNCVINLSPDKHQVFREAYRVLKIGGRLLVSDIVLNKPLPEKLKDDADLYSSCIAGALPRQEYIQAIRDAGFGNVQIIADSSYKATSINNDPITSSRADQLENVAASITVLAIK